MQRSNYRDSILALLQIPLGLPYIFFNSPEGTSVKIDISPTQTSQPTQVKVRINLIFVLVQRLNLRLEVRKFLQLMEQFLMLESKSSYGLERQLVGRK